MHHRALGLVALLALTLAAAPSLPARAAPEVVGNGTAASCTAQALAAALTNGGSITFSCGAAPHTILVTQAFDITAQETSIDGGGLITLQGQGSRIITHRTFGNIGSSVLTLKNLTIAGGRAIGGGSTADEANGGAVRSVFQAAQPQFKPALVVENVIFRDNDATLTAVPAGLSAADYGGGAIFSQGGSVTIRGSQFIDNDAANGGGGAIHILQSGLSIESSSFTNNTAIGATPQDSQGGAIYIDGLGGAGGSFRVEASSFSNNRAYNSGGAVYLNLYENSSSALILASSFDGNAVVGGARAQGGAIGGGGTSAGGAMGNPLISINGSLFTGNSVRRTVGAEGNSTEDGSGGALAFPQRARLSITNSTFEGNRAFGSGFNANGGALYVVNNTDPFEIVNSTFANNFAGWVGGAISNSQIGGQPGGRVRATLFSNNTADNGPNSWDIQQHCSSELAHDGLSLQYPPRLTGANFFNDVTCFVGKSAPGQTGDPQFRDPRLGALAANGGPTRTMAIGATSPAFDAVADAATCAATDQRGVTRPQAGGCDLGAFELVVRLGVSSPLIEVGASERTRTVSGAGFTATSVVQVNGADRPTTFVSPTALQVELSAGDVAAPGTLTLSVRGPGGELEATTIRVVAELYHSMLPLVQR